MLCLIEVIRSFGVTSLFVILLKVSLIGINLEKLSSTDFNFVAKAGFFSVIIVFIDFTISFMTSDFLLIIGSELVLNLKLSLAKSEIACL